MTALPARLWRQLVPFFVHPRLGLGLAALALAASASALWLGFYLDDFIGRYVYSELPGAARLFRNYSGGYGLALGDPAEAHWQKEAGWAPWWHYDTLRLALYRPIGIADHMIDFRLWPDNAPLMHLHNLLWLGGLTLAMTWMYRSVLGHALGGAAALLFALDHTHGFAVGHICSRHTLISGLFGALSLGFHLRPQRQSGGRAAFLGPLFYLLALLTNEAAIAVLAYVLAHALCVEQGAFEKRALRTAPYLALTLIWRALYTAAGYGAFGSGIYIDPGREPLQFVRALLERGPVLWLAQFLLPPAETYVVLQPALGAWLMLAFALLVLGASAWALLPLLRHDRYARFWLLGLSGALVPGAAGLPHNRQLLFVSVGAMGLLAQLWHSYLVPGSASLWAQRFGAALLGFRLVLSPLWLPVATLTVALMAPMHYGAASVGDEVAGRDLIFVTAPEFYTVRLVQLMKRLEGAPLPRRIRAISCEPEPIRVKRVDSRVLEVHYLQGLLSKPMTDDLHRDRRLSMPAGSKVHISGFRVEVVHALSDGRPDRVRFEFERPLEDPGLAFFRWDQRRFVPFQPPALGHELELPGAVAPFNF